MEPFNQDELGLFDDWEPAVWSEIEPVAFEDEMTEKMDAIAEKQQNQENEEEEEEEEEEEIIQPTAIEQVTVVSSSPDAKMKSVKEVYEYNSSGNLITRPHAIGKHKHDKFLDRLPDSPDELQDVGVMNAGKGFGYQNSSMGITAPVNSSNLHWEYKNWKPGQSIKASQDKINEAIKQDKESMHNDFEIVNLP